VTGTGAATIELGAASNVNTTFYASASFTGGLSVTPIEDLSGTNTFPIGINDGGQIVGYYDTSSIQYSFLDSNGTYTTLYGPSGATSTTASGINDLGQIVGTYSDALGSHGFLYSNGTYTTLYGPSGIDIVPTGINDEGQIVGYYESNALGNSNGSSLHGFLESNGAFTALDDPSGSWATAAEGINNEGQIVGYYSFDGGFDENGFLYNNGTYTRLDAPSPFNQQGYNVFPTSINDAGQIVGSLELIGSSGYGFVDNNGTYTTLYNQDSAVGFSNYELTPSSINDSGQIVGNDSFISGAGFLANINQGNTLKLDDAPQFTGTVAGFAGGDSIDMTDINFATLAPLKYKANAGNTGGTLTVSDGTNTAKIALLGQYLAAGFSDAPDSGTGSVITYTPPPAQTSQTLLATPQHS
jgi:probable HAF family extracellular repeat protein